MSEPYSHRLRADRLPVRRVTAVDLIPDAEARARIAAALDLTALAGARLTGTLAPAPADAWAFDGRIQAEVVQPCGVTLAPVTTRIDEAVRRVWSPHAGTAPASGAEEVEMGDDETDPLGAEIDLGAVLVEALALAVPPFPRAPGASLDAPEADAGETRRPFAGLADLLRRE